MYDTKKWFHDVTFKAAPGEEVTEEIYNKFMEMYPAEKLPKTIKGYSAGFVVASPVDYDYKAKKYFYMAFGNNGSKYYYIGQIAR